MLSTIITFATKQVGSKISVSELIDKYRSEPDTCLSRDIKSLRKEILKMFKNHTPLGGLFYNASITMFYDVQEQALKNDQRTNRNVAK